MKKLSKITLEFRPGLPARLLRSEHWLRTLCLLADGHDVPARARHKTTRRVVEVTVEL